MPERKRRASMAAWAAGIERDFADTTLSLDSNTLKIWGQFYAKHEADGQQRIVFLEEVHHGAAGNLLSRRKGSRRRVAAG
jgi:hypothetical protein